MTVNNTIKNEFGYICNVRRFEAPEEYADYLEHVVSRRYRDFYYSGHRDQNFTSALKGMREGSMEHINAAQKVMDQLQQEGIFSIGLPMPSRAVVGAQTIFPLYEAGIPNCMITRDMGTLKGVNAPLNIYWDRFRSDGIASEANIINRGVAITAFVMAMNRIRPVNLYVISCSCPRAAHGEQMGLFGGLVRIETRPLDLARATWMFTNDQLSGPLTFMAMRQQFEQATGVIASGYEYVARGPLHLRYSPSDARYAAEHRSILEMNPDDVFIHGMHLNDELSYTNPVQWVKNMIEKHAKKTQESN